MTEPQAPTEQDGDPSAAVPVRRASTLSVLAGMTAISLVVSAGLVVWMRTAAPTAAATPVSGTETEVPESLAGGIAFEPVPEQVSAAVDEPVVGAAVVSELPEGLGGCGFGEVVDPELERAYALPGAIVLSMVGEANPEFFGRPMPAPIPEPLPDFDLDADDGLDDGVDVGFDDGFMEPFMGRWRETCLMREHRNSWTTDLSSSGPADDHGGFGAAMTCCDGGFATALTMIDVPDEAAWVLQNRGVYWLAFPVEAGHQVPITWRYRETSLGRGQRSALVLLLDPTGGVVEERIIDV